MALWDYRPQTPKMANLFAIMPNVILTHIILNRRQVNTIWGRSIHRAPVGFEVPVQSAPGSCHLMHHTRGNAEFLLCLLRKGNMILLAVRLRLQHTIFPTTLPKGHHKCWTGKVWDKEEKTFILNSRKVTGLHPHLLVTIPFSWSTTPPCVASLSSMHICIKVMADWVGNMWVAWVWPTGMCVCVTHSAS